MTTTQTIPQPYTTKSLLRAMAPVDMVIDSFLREQAITRSPNFVGVDVHCDEGDIKRSPWSVSSQGQFASLIASISIPKSKSSDLDWSTCQFLPSQRYISKLVSRYIVRMEKAQHADNGVVELEDDELVSLVCHFSISSRMSTSVPDPDSSCLLTFEVPIKTTNTPDFICVHESNESDFLQLRTFPHHNDVGLKLWEAGACLSEYLLRYPEIVRAKNVVELGAGVGLTGLIASVCGGFRGSAQNVHMTDYTEGTLENLRFNVEVNAQWSKKRGAEVRNVSVVSKYRLYSLVLHSS